MFLVVSLVVFLVVSLVVLLLKHQTINENFTNRPVDITPYIIFSDYNLIVFNEFKRAINEYNDLIYVSQENITIKRLAENILILFDRMTFHVPYDTLRKYAQRMKYELTQNVRMDI